METTSPEHRIGGSENHESVHERYGKADFLASVIGTFAGLGVLVFLSALIAAGPGGAHQPLTTNRNHQPRSDQ